MGVASLMMQIPTDAVEMPSDTVDELGIQFGNLGIGFGDTNESLGTALEVQKVGVAWLGLMGLSCDCHVIFMQRYAACSGAQLH